MRWLFAAGQGVPAAQARVSVIQTRALQKLQAVPDLLLHDLTADLPLLLGQVRLIFGNEFQLIPDGHFAELADVLIPNGHCQHHRLQALAVAVGALTPDMKLPISSFIHSLLVSRKRRSRFSTMPSNVL